VVVTAAKDDRTAAQAVGENLIEPLVVLLPSGEEGRGIARADHFLHTQVTIVLHSTYLAGGGANRNNKGRLSPYLHF